MIVKVPAIGGVPDVTCIIKTSVSFDEKSAFALVETDEMMNGWEMVTDSDILKLFESVHGIPDKPDPLDELREMVLDLQLMILETGGAVK